MRAVLIGLAFFGLTITSRASIASDCDRLLEPDTVSFNQNTVLAIAYLSSMTQQQSDKVDTKWRSSWDGALGKMNGDLDHDRDTARAAAQKLDYKWNFAEAMSYYGNRVPEARSAQFVDCLRTKEFWVELSG